VHLPEGLKKAIQAVYDQEWHLLALPERLGGTAAPSVLTWAAFELMVGANAPVAFYMFGPIIARIIDALGTESRRSATCSRCSSGAGAGRWC
jgi:alkylation response protein AidB-like acyl-CoA dehydrogenase